MMCTGRRLRISLLSAPWLLTTMAPASAHTTEGGFVLLLPTGYYIAGGTLAVLASFFLVFLLPARMLEGLAGGRRKLGEVRLPPAQLTSSISTLILFVLILAGFLGSRDPRTNPLPIAIWSLGWVGFVFLQAACGDLWHRLNPWIAPYRMLLHLFGRQQPGRSHAAGQSQIYPSSSGLTRGSVGNTSAAEADPRVKPEDDEQKIGLHRIASQPPLRYPDWLGYWPAILGFAGFAWFELVDLAPSDPTRLANAILLYGAVTLTGLVLFGEVAWLGRADPFSVFLRLIAHLSPLVAEPAGQDRPDHRTLYLTLPGARLFDLAALPLSGILFVLLTLSTVSFDGLSKTFWWLSLGGINPLDFPGRSAVVWLNTLGLLGLWSVLVAAYLLAIALGRWINPALPPSRAAGLLVVSIIPISLAYHFSHYLTLLLVDVQYAVKALSDPFGLGWDLLGTQHYHVTTSFLANYHSVAMLWNLQAGAIVLGHLLAVAVAHIQNARLGDDGWRAPLGQLPLAGLMVLYTLFGLWLLATATAG